MHQAKVFKYKYYFIGSGAIFLLLAAPLVYAQISHSIRDNVYINSIPVGGLTQEEAELAVAQGLNGSTEEDLKIVIEGKPYPVPASDIHLTYDIRAAVRKAWGIGRSSNVFKNLKDLFVLRFTTAPIALDYSFDERALRSEIESIASLVDEPSKDIRIKIDGDLVTLLTDVKEGFVIDQNTLYEESVRAFSKRPRATVSVPRTRVVPSVASEEGPHAQEVAVRMIAEPLLLETGQQTLRVIPSEIGSWITSKPYNSKLLVAIDDAMLGAYVVELAATLNAEPQSPRVSVVDGKVNDFVAPRRGQKLNHEKTIADIKAVLAKRAGATNAPEGPDTITLLVEVTHPEIADVSAIELGIKELIGSASTRFTGSPPNRIANIKNGVNFLTGHLIKPNEEFSTLQALGTIDNTTGYLPELVIKENRTVPEYGGGLCQVSTTLFRATMNTGLPITARQNHSYRVAYYETDGDGNYIGPGLDATIYDPAPDFKFINDTGAHILIQGSVVGDKITFDFYGTRDGRHAVIEGPKLLSSTPAGEPIYAETDTLKPGEIRQLERPHPGGTAVASYTIQYADGTEKKSEYKSFYRNWPARFLVGADPNKPTTPEETTKEAVASPETEAPAEAPLSEASL